MTVAASLCAARLMRYALDRLREDSGYGCAQNRSEQRLLRQR